MKFLPTALFLFCSLHLFSQGSYPAPFCNDTATLGTCKDGKLIDGRQYVYDAKGNLAEVRLFLDGKYVGNGLIKDTVVPPAPIRTARPQVAVDTLDPDKTRRTEAVPVKYYIDSAEQSVDCSYIYDTSAAAHNAAPPVNGEGYGVVMRDGKDYQKGYFRNGKLDCGIEYVYKKGRLRTVNVYQRGIITKKVKVPKGK